VLFGISEFNDFKVRKTLLCQELTWYLQRMYIKTLKVRPKKNLQPNLCAVQLAAMLGCWAATNDLASAGPCSETAQALFECMRTTPMRGKQPQPTINYHLARLGKTLK